MSRVIPRRFSFWRHKGGNLYFLYDITSRQSQRLDEYPIMLSYLRLKDFTTWSRPLTRWHGSMRRVSLIEVLRGRV